MYRQDTTTVTLPMSTNMTCILYAYSIRETSFGILKYLYTLQIFFFETIPYWIQSTCTLLRKRRFETTRITLCVCVCFRYLYYYRENIRVYSVKFK